MRVGRYLGRRQTLSNDMPICNDNCCPVVRSSGRPVTDGAAFFAGLSGPACRWHAAGQAWRFNHSQTKPRTDTGPVVGGRGPGTAAVAGPAVRRAPQSGQIRSGCFGDGAGLGAGVAALRGSVFATGFSCCAFTLRMPAASLLDVLFMIAITPRSGLQLRGRPPCRGVRAHTHWCLPLRRCGRRRAGRDRRAGRGIPAPPALRA